MYNRKFFYLLSNLLVLLLVSCGGIFITSKPTLPSSTNSPPGSPSLVEGTVLTYDSKTILIKTENKQVILEISNSTIIWDGIIWIAEIPMEIGDFVIARGTWTSDNSLAVDLLYVNIVNLRGTVSKVLQNQDNASFSITDQNQIEDQVIVSILTKVYEINVSGQSTYQESHLLPRDGDIVEVIGRKLKDGSILASSITIP